MSSPGARQRRRREQYQTPRSRREVVTAVGAGVAIVAATSLVIWLLRPGGLADRQPRSSWLVGIVIGAIALASYVVLRPSSKLKMSRRVALGGSYAIIAVAAVIAAAAWPHGLIRHTPTFATVPPAASTTAPKPGASSTTAAVPTTTSPTSTSPKSTTTATHPPASPST